MWTRSAVNKPIGGFSSDDLVAFVTQRDWRPGPLGAIDRPQLPHRAAVVHRLVADLVAADIHRDGPLSGQYVAVDSSRGYLRGLAR